VRPKDKGEMTEAIVLAELAKRGYPVLLPFGDNQRYDFVVERDGRFVRLQCKTGRLRKGAVEFCCTSTYQTYGMQKRHTHYRGQIDAFIVWCYENEEVYLVPVDDAGTNRCCLRVAPARNGQISKTRPADRYRLDSQWPIVRRRRPTRCRRCGDGRMVGGSWLRGRGSNPGPSD
jgi:hypothetical protein